MSKKDELQELQNDYADAFFDFIESLLPKAPVKSIPEALKGKLLTLYSIMPESFKKDFGIKVSNTLLTLQFVVNENMYDFITDTFSKKQLFDSEGSKFSELIKKLINEKNVAALEFVASILNKDDSDIFKPDSHYADILRKPLIELQQQENIKDSVDIIAKKFSIDISIPGVSEIEKE